MRGPDLGCLLNAAAYTCGVISSFPVSDSAYHGFKYSLRNAVRCISQLDTTLHTVPGTVFHTISMKGMFP